MLRGCSRPLRTRAVYSRLAAIGEGRHATAMQHEALAHARESRALRLRSESDAEVAQTRIAQVERGCSRDSAVVVRLRQLVTVEFTRLEHPAATAI